LALGDGNAGQGARQLAHPGAGRQHQAGGLVAALVCRDRDALPTKMRVPAQHALAGLDVGPVRQRQRDMRHHRPLAGDEAALGLEHGAMGAGQVVAGKAGVDLSAGQYLVRQRVLAGGRQGALEQRVPFRA